MDRVGLARSRSHAADLIRRGHITVSGEVVTRPAKVVHESDAIASSMERGWVSRGSLKLLAALESFELDLHGLAAVDIGASTGGFTQVLLEHGVSGVVAIDVGSDQLAPVLRRDPRVVVLEETNFRTMNLGPFEQTFDVAVVDLSFVSVALLSRRIASVVQAGGDVVVLVKPQFEVGKGSLGKDGVVRDPEAVHSAVEKVSLSFSENGFSIKGLIDSPITGRAGNREYLLWLQRDRTRTEEAEK